MASFSALGRIDAVVGFPECDRQAADLAAALGVPLEIADVHTFPDGENRIRVKAHGQHVAVYRALDHPNDKLFDLFLTASALRDLGTAKVSLIAPYLPYMRQDIAFEKGQAVSQRVFGQLFSSAFDGFVAVDPHLHRTRDLDAVFAGKPALALTSALEIAAHIRSRGFYAKTLIVGPDEESLPFVREIAEAVGVKWFIASKTRKGDREVSISIPADVTAKDQAIVVVDDVISTGMTLIQIARYLRFRGAASVDAYATHVLCDNKAASEIRAAGVERIVSCDGVSHPTNDISIARVIAAGLSRFQKVPK